MAPRKPNREILTGGQKYKEAKKVRNRVDEVTFDTDSRVSYLTGFHKRKVERKKNAQKHAVEMMKKERIEERARIRAERQEQVRKKLEEMKQALELNPFLQREDESDDGEDDDEEKESKKSVGWEEQPWDGIKDDGDDDEDEENENDEDGSSNGTVKPILKKQIYNIDNSDAPVVGQSEVIIESLEKSSITAPVNLTSLHVDMTKSGEVLDESIQRAKKYARLMGVAEKKSPSEPEKPMKVKKKKFRYLSKTERKANTMKERAVAAKRSGPKKDGKKDGKKSARK